MNKSAYATDKATKIRLNACLIGFGLKGEISSETQKGTC